VWTFAIKMVETHKVSKCGTVGAEANDSFLCAEVKTGWQELREGVRMQADTCACVI
jgi:hypothetical protein